MIKLTSLIDQKTRNFRQGENALVEEFVEDHFHSVKAVNAVKDREFNGFPDRIKSCSVMLIGMVSGLLYNSAGEIIFATAGQNIVTTLGLAAAIDRLQGATPAVHDYIAIGTGVSAVAVGDTTLEAENARGLGDLTQPVATQDRCIEVFDAGVGTGTIGEAGRLNAASSGNLFCHKLFASTIPKGASDALNVTYDIDVT